MHCELIVPGLFAEAADTRAPALELLLARGRGTNGEAHSVESWLQEAFGLEDAPIAAGALTLVANGTDPGGACWARADPVHLRLLRDRLIVVPGAAFELTAAEAHALVDALNGHFAGALHLQATDAYRWCLRLEDPLAFHSVPPIEAAGRDVDLTARIGGEAGKRWKQVLTEAQMLLHAHPVNQAREEHGLPAVNSLWLWGAGSAPAVPAGRWRTVAATDPLPLGLARPATPPRPAAARAPGRRRTGRRGWARCRPRDATSRYSTSCARRSRSGTRPSCTTSSACWRRAGSRRCSRRCATAASA